MPDYQMSWSRFRKWCTCPAATYAEYVEHTYAPPTTTAMALGSLADALLIGDPGAVDEVEARHREHLYKRGNIPRADTMRVYDLVERARANSELAALLDSATAHPSYYCDIGGVVWRCEPDLVVRSPGAVWDVKTPGKSAWEQEYSPAHRKRTLSIFVQAYHWQLAVYREAVRQCEGIECDIAGLVIMARTKDEDGNGIPDLATPRWHPAYLYQLDHAVSRAAHAMANDFVPPIGHWVDATLPPVMGMQTGACATPRCERCDYCIQTRLDGAKSDGLMFWICEPERRETQ